MNNCCKYAGGGYCLCSTCQMMREAMENAEKINPDEVFKEFEDMQKVYEEMLRKDQEGK